MKKANIVRYKLKIIGVGCVATLRVLLVLVCAAAAGALYWRTSLADGYMAVLYFVAGMMLTVKTTDLLYKCGAWVVGKRGEKT